MNFNKNEYYLKENTCYFCIAEIKSELHIAEFDKDYFIVDENTYEIEVKQNV